MHISAFVKRKSALLCRLKRIDLVIVFDAILTRGQTRACEKLQCLYENLMSNDFCKMAVLKKKVNFRPKLKNKGLY